VLIVIVLFPSVLTLLRAEVELRKSRSGEKLSRARRL
jgi:hypothetical protein